MKSLGFQTCDQRITMMPYLETPSVLSLFLLNDATFIWKSQIPDTPTVTLSRKHMQNICED